MCETVISTILCKIVHGNTYETQCKELFPTDLLIIMTGTEYYSKKGGNQQELEKIENTDKLFYFCFFISSNCLSLLFPSNVVTII